MSTLNFSDIKDVFERYRPDIVVNIPDTMTFNESLLKTDIKDQIIEETINYLSISYDLIKKRERYYKNNMISLRQWFTKIYELLDSMENIILLCEDISNIYKNQTTWARSLAIQYMVDIIENLKSEINIFRNNIKQVRSYNLLREKASRSIAIKISHFLEVLFTIIEIENGETSPDVIISAIGRDTSSIWELYAGA